MPDTEFRSRFEKADTSAARRTILEQWLGADVWQAATVVRDWNGRPEERQALLISAVEHWARQDPASAAAFVSSVGPESTAAVLLVPLLLEWPRRAAQSAVDWASKLPECPGPGTVSVLSMAGYTTLEGTRFCRGDAFEVVGFGWGRIDREAAMAWAKSLTPDAVRKAVIEKVDQSRHYR